MDEKKITSRTIKVTMVVIDEQKVLFFHNLEIKSSFSIKKNFNILISCNWLVFYYLERKKMKHLLLFLVKSSILIFMYVVNLLLYGLEIFITLCTQEKKNLETRV